MRWYPSVTKRLLSFPPLRHAVNVPQPTTSPPPLGAPTSDPDASTVERLLQAAAHAFADKGFHATTTRDIASGAGLSPAGVYVHFGSKEELLFNLSRSGHESALRLLRSAIAEKESPSAQLERDVLERGVTHGAFTVDASADTALALLSIVVDVARWYSPTIHRTPAEIGSTNAALALRLVGADA